VSPARLPEREGCSLLRQPGLCQHAEMETDTEPDRARAVRIRAYLGRFHDMGRTFRAPAGADPAALMKRTVLAVLPKAEGWHLLVVVPAVGAEDAARIDHLRAALAGIGR
jgi:hypothetical protein